MNRLFKKLNNQLKFIKEKEHENKLRLKGGGTELSIWDQFPKSNNPDKLK